MILIAAVAWFFGTLTVYTVASKIPCSDIIDIYTNDLRYTDKDCPYTQTLICKDCKNYYIGRKEYDDWAKGFADLGLEPPHKKRFDLDKIIQPIK